MPSSAGSNSPERRSALALTAVALAALALALLLAYASTLRPHPRATGPATAQEGPVPRFGAQPTPAAAGSTPAATAQPAAGAPPQAATLWALLTPWALAIDALALVGIAVVVALRRALPGRRGARR